MRIQRFALDAIGAIEGTTELTVFSCRNTRLKRNVVRHACYYALNLLAVRNRLARFVPISAGSNRIAATIEFDCEHDGAWQRLPAKIIDQLNKSGFDVILKFGMGLLRVPTELSVPILSYHHGDPDRYRGRPAGFWEIADNVSVMGQMVQIISNRLDAGAIVAYAETKVLPWAWRATLVESYTHSPLILNTAIRNALAGKTVNKACNGRNCRLPSNWATLKFILRMAWMFVKRLGYGMFREKVWRVSAAAVQDRTQVIHGRAFPPPPRWRTADVAPGYTFYADPFFVGETGAILVEALNRKTGYGEIVRIEGSNHEAVLQSCGHISYPATQYIGGRELVIPEAARWSSPIAYEMHGRWLQRIVELKIEGEPRVLDPNLFERDGRVYLFGNIRDVGPTALFLWHANALEGTFALHPSSPIRISPRGSRMGGAIVELDDQIFRVGQDFTGAYGDGLIMFEISKMSPRSYQERELGRIRFSDRRGPHTLNLRSGEAVFDWYRDRVSLFAGIRRARARSATVV